MKISITKLKQALTHTANYFHRKSVSSRQPVVLAMKQTHLGTATNTIWCQIFVHIKCTHFTGCSKGG